MMLGKAKQAQSSASHTEARALDPLQMGSAGCSVLQGGLLSWLGEFHSPRYLCLTFAAVQAIISKSISQARKRMNVSIP